MQPENEFCNISGNVCSSPEAKSIVHETKLYKKKTIITVCPKRIVAASAGGLRYAPYADYQTDGYTPLAIIIIIIIGV